MVHLPIRVILGEIIVSVAGIPSALLPEMLGLGWPRQGRYIAPMWLRRRRGAERTLVHRPLQRPRRLLGLRRGGRRWREAPVGGSDNRAEPPHRRHVDSAGAHGGGPGVRWEVGVSRARGRIRVPGEEERGGHGQGAEPAKVADATPQDGGQEHHYQRRRRDIRLTCLMQSPSAAAALRAAGTTVSMEVSSPLYCGGLGLCARRKR